MFLNSVVLHLASCFPDDQTDGGAPPDALAPFLLVHHQDPHLRSDKMFMRRELFLQKLPLPSWNRSEAK